MWLGGGAQELGLEGGVERADLLRVWEGRDPRSGEIQVRRSAAGEHVAAVDCTFSAPKSVSVVWALGTPSTRAAVERAQDRAVAVAVDHLERTVPLLRRRVAGRIEHERSAGLVAARFRHRTSRLSADQAAAGTAPDPQLHDHVVIANMALRSGDPMGHAATWGAIDSRQLYLAAMEAGAVYRAELADRLQRLGFLVDRDGRYFEVRGVPETVRRAFSGRTAEVEAAKRRFTQTYGRQPRDDELRSITVNSRQPKAGPFRPAFTEWVDRGRQAGLSPERVAELQVLRAVPVNRAVGVALARVDLLDPTSPHCLTATDATVDERRLRIAVAEAAQGRIQGSLVGELIEEVMSSPELIRLFDGRWTTRRMRELELDVFGTGVDKSVTRHYEVTASAVAAASTEARVPLSEEQRSAVGSVCDSPGLVLLSAPAGSGKGEVLHTAARAYAASGYSVTALAAAGETAQRLGTDLGVPAQTLDSFIRRGTRTSAHDVLIVDEAALLETTRWRGLLEATSRLVTDASSPPSRPAGYGGSSSGPVSRSSSATTTEPGTNGPGTPGPRFVRDAAAMP